MGDKSKCVLLLCTVLGCAALLIICVLYFYYGSKYGPCPLIPSLRLLMTLVGGLTLTCAISIGIVLSGAKGGFSIDSFSGRMTACCILVLMIGAVCCIIATFIVYIIISANVFTNSKIVQYSNPNASDYCDYKLFTAAYALTISTWVIFILTSLCACFLGFALKND